MQYLDDVVSNIMSYKLNRIKIRTNNYKKGIKSINHIWKDIASGKLPILYAS